MPGNQTNHRITHALEEARAARARYRSGQTGPTAGVAPGLAQANMIAVPRDWAWDFLLYCQRNPKPCPILDVIEAGGHTSILAPNADLRTDLPLYRIWRDGRLIEEIPDAIDAWVEHPDLVTFLLGCSFTFEGPLLDEGIEVRHITDGSNVPMYVTNRPCRPAGRVHGQLVVSMRPIAAHRVADAVQISARYPSVHGAPVHIGDPAALGINDLGQPDFGDAVRIAPGELPVFWACGVTPQAAVMASGVPFAVTHAPGCMFITDVPDLSYHI